ncbi:M20/M25/M40 family metallo-hydrolase [Myxococcota bacterium]|nr:M20/M25/M40 family metallo-hydrolase [Myxococcota bacterium]
MPHRPPRCLASLAALAAAAALAHACAAPDDETTPPDASQVPVLDAVPAPGPIRDAAGAPAPTPDAAPAAGGDAEPEPNPPPDAAAEPDPTPPTVDPLALAAQVDPDALRRTIAELEAMGTRYTYSDGDERARDYLVERLRVLGFEAELDAFTFRGETAENVIARKRGTADAPAVLVFSAHYDSTSETPETLAPGADDNASAVAAVLEAARLLGPLPLAHDVWFVFTAAEEQGSVGSAHLAQRLALERFDVRGVIAPDMIGYWPLGDDDALDVLGDMGSVDLVDRMCSVADALGVPYKRWIEHEYCYGDDHTNFQERGFPAIAPMDCVEAHNIPASGEELGHYHRSTDTLDTLHMPFTTRVVGVIVATLAELARGETGR